MAFARAFQHTAFQDEAFQIHDRTPAVIDPGSRIVAGSFSKGQWRDLQRDLAVKRAEAKRKREAADAALESERQRQIAAIAAEIAARRAEEDAAHLAQMAAIQGQVAPPVDALGALQQMAQQAGEQALAAKHNEIAKAQAEEDEAIALLLM
jgi:hypothetical protein